MKPGKTGVTDGAIVGQRAQNENPKSVGEQGSTRTNGQVLVKHVPGQCRARGDGLTAVGGVAKQRARCRGRIDAGRALRSSRAGRPSRPSQTARAWKAIYTRQTRHTS